ncbi:acyltransferase [Bacterioplanes sanyensis]|nr:acyltransferase [Bacterioplanes sanyensis]
MEHQGYMPDLNDPYADIRPYSDHEVAPVLQRLLHSPRVVDAVINHRLTAVHAWQRPLLRPWLRRRLAQQLKNTASVADFQQWLEPQIERLLLATTTEVEVRGLEQLQPNKAYTWISNHRDIAMDPTFVNFTLHRAGWPTSRIAIGDNLLSDPDVADIMRLNKSFVVKRTVSGRREKLQELTRLSQFIAQSNQQGHSVWIAQREGRAKDNRDLTDTAVLKMLSLYGRAEKLSFTDAMAALNPVPVCIYYEWDPCDVLKARELVALSEQGEYHKQDHEDMHSIIQGLTGFKGKVCVSFGQPLTSQDLASAEYMAEAIDRQILDMTPVYDVQHAAVALLDRNQGEPASEAGKVLQARVAQESAEVRRRVWQTYAAPLLNY